MLLLGICAVAQAEEPITIRFARAGNVQDPDGNGVDDTYGIWDYFGLPYIERCFAINAPNMGPNSGETCWVEQADGTVTRYEISDQNLEAMKFLRKAYQEGLLKPDFITTKVDSDIGYANFAAGKYGLCDTSNPQLAYEPSCP